MHVVEPVGEPGFPDPTRRQVEKPVSLFNEALAQQTQEKLPRRFGP